MTTSAPSTYCELRVELPPESEEIWTLFCYEQGAVGAEHIHPPLEFNVGIKFFFSHLSNDTKAEFLQTFSHQYPAIPGPISMAFTDPPTEDWGTAWQVHFAPKAVGEEFIICPPWEVVKDQGRMPLVIEPGQGFGTGGHPTTRLALSLLETLLQRPASHETPLPENHPPKTMLDVGTGSGILSIGACLLGVEQVTGIDIDGCVFSEIRHNFSLNTALANHAPPHLIHGSPDSLKSQFPLVVANITTDVLLAYKENLVALSSRDLIFSGVLKTEEATILQGFKDVLTLKETRYDEEWCGFWFQVS